MKKKKNAAKTVAAASRSHLLLVVCLICILMIGSAVAMILQFSSIIEQEAVNISVQYTENALDNLKYGIDAHKIMAQNYGESAMNIYDEIKSNEEFYKELDEETYKNLDKEFYTRISRLKDSSLPSKINPQKSHKNNAGGIIVEGLDDCLVKFARCCTPIPGDDIVGYVTKGYGISVHRKDCVNASPELRFGADRERWVNVWWGSSTKGKYTAKLQIFAKTRLGLLADIAMCFSNLKINVLELSAKDLAETNESVISAQIQISDLPQLDTIILKLKKIKGISKIKRI